MIINTNNIISEQVRDNATVDSNCCKITFRNKGEATALIDKAITIDHNDSVSLGGVRNAQITQRFGLEFTSGGSKLVEVIRERLSNP